MRVIIEKPADGDEDEIIVRCREPDDEIMSLIYSIAAGRSKLTAYSEDGIVKLSPKEIFYFEAVDNKVFAYCEKQVYEIRRKLYELEETFENSDFLRISKSTIVNVSKIVKLVPYFNSRLEAVLENGERTIISRQYVPDLKRKLRVEEVITEIVMSLPEPETKKRFVLYTALHYVVLCIVMSVIGMLFDWVSKTVLGVLLMCLSVAAVYAFTMAVTYFTSKRDADDLTKLIRSKYRKK